MKEGDIITTYYKGFYRLTRIQRRFYGQDGAMPTFVNAKDGDEYLPLYWFVKVADAKGTPVKPGGKENACDASFCMLATDFINGEIAKVEAHVAMLRAFAQTL